MLCPNPPDICSKKEHCSFAHTIEEVKYHPTTYKTELCPLLQQCKDKIHCEKAHSNQELRNVTPYYILSSSSQISTGVNSSVGSSLNSLQGTSGGNNRLLKKMSDLSISGPSKRIQSYGNLQEISENKVKEGYYPNNTNKEAQFQNHDAGDVTIASIDLFNFKTQQCKLPFQHNPKKCFFYHEVKKDRRRALGAYTSEICPYIISNQTNYECQMGDSCPRAHNRVEEFYHPEKYKVKFCSAYPGRIDQCDYGEMCAFAHAEEELTVDLLDKFTQDTDFYIFHFKTVWCPYSDTTHARDACVYAHNWQDFRRKPHQFEYERDQCPQWETKNFIQTYADGCKHEYRCKYSHGWKEQEYHPLNYKIHSCRIGESCAKPHCPYYHNESDRRQPLSQYFKLFPKNRGSSVHPNQIYQPLYLNLLFNVPSRTSQTFVDQITGMQQLIYNSQLIYGCSPQSIPIVDPKVVQAYQTCQMQKSQQITSQAISHSQPFNQPQFTQDSYGQSQLRMNSSQSNFIQNQQFQNQLPLQQPQFGRAQSHNNFMNQNIVRPQYGSSGALNLHATEFKARKDHTQGGVNLYGQNDNIQLHAPPGFEDINTMGRFQTSQSQHNFFNQDQQNLKLESNQYNIPYQMHHQQHSQQSIRPSGYSQPNLLQHQQQQNQPFYYQQQPQQQLQQQPQSFGQLPQSQNFEKIPLNAQQPQLKQYQKHQSLIQSKLLQSDGKKHNRKKSEEDQLEVNLEEPLSDDYEEEDDYKDIQKIIENTKQRTKIEPSEIQLFLQRINLAQLIPVVDQLHLKTVQELKAIHPDQIRQYLGQEYTELSEELIKQLSIL